MLDPESRMAAFSGCWKIPAWLEATPLRTRPSQIYGQAARTSRWCLILVVCSTSGLRVRCTGLRLKTADQAADLRRTGVQIILPAQVIAVPGKAVHHGRLPIG